jgi:hypothetical protein
LGVWNFGPLAIGMAEIVKTCKYVKIKSTIFRPLGLIVQLVLRPNGVAVINKLLRFYIVLETKFPKGVENAFNLKCVVPIM